METNQAARDLMRRSWRACSRISTQLAAPSPARALDNAALQTQIEPGVLSAVSA
jgi:hypothetical protein